MNVDLLFMLGLVIISILWWLFSFKLLGIKVLFIICFIIRWWLVLICSLVFFVSIGWDKVSVLACFVKQASIFSLAIVVKFVCKLKRGLEKCLSKDLKSVFLCDREWFFVFSVLFLNVFNFGVI